MPSVDPLPSGDQKYGSLRLMPMSRTFRNRLIAAHLRQLSECAQLGRHFFNHRANRRAQRLIHFDLGGLNAQNKYMG